MPSFFPSCVWWMFDSTSHGLRRIWPSPAHQATRALKYSHPGAAEWTPVPDSLFKVNNAPAVTPSMRPNHINEACQREIQRETPLYPCILCCLSNLWHLFLRQSATVLKSVCFHKGQSFSCYFRLSSWENGASLMFISQDRMAYYSLPTAFNIYTHTQIQFPF